MKRSEAVVKVLEQFPEWNDQIKLDGYDVSAIIGILEKSGMLPPPYNTRLENGLEVRMVDWEPE